MQGERYSPRIQEHPILSFERGRKIKFFFDGREIEAYEGETITAALYAAGIRQLTESLKYRRPRGFFCAIGKCSSCLAQVDGVSNVKTCVTLVKEGMDVRSQKRKFSLLGSLVSAALKRGLFPSVGGHYKKLVGGPLVWPLARRAIKAMAGFGEFPEPNPTLGKFLPSETWEGDLVVIGGGPAGISAALYGAKLGLKVALVDENSRLGGQLVKQTHRFFGSKEYYAGTRGFEIGRILEKEAASYSNITVLLDTTVFGFYPGNILGAVQKIDFCKEKMVKLRAKRMVFATGAYERTLIFENNDLPGVMGAGGVQTLMNVQGIRPGKNGLIIGAGNVGLILAYQLLQAGVRVEAVIEAMPGVGGYFVHAAKIRRAGVPILTSHTILKALGKGSVEGAVVAKLDDKWNPLPGSEKELECDFICVAVGLHPSFELPYQAGCQLKYVPELGGMVPVHDQWMETSVPGIYIAGDTSGIEEASTAILGGRIAGLSAGLSLVKDREAEKLRSEFVKALEEFRDNPLSAKIREGKKKAQPR
ncbi:FAD-dependent oxidoreductase [Candidatus Hecatella orcuttiae]|jgi:sarcosine oxidase subunit alpha|uniref:FAD-dependent oxidoreductase n=1 Tax=Candidatus Hecatella orcuttiae TaxID=1935119 RepID=UPI00286811BD|nr:FAD-dependent oxidoreductase [Candidatus Hecatella orcuttiae]